MDAQVLWHMFISSAMGVALLQWLKKAPWFPFAKQVGTKKMNRVLAIILALFGATGISYVWNPQQHTLLLTNLSLWGVINALWHWIQQFVLQETVYQATANRVPDKV